MKKIIWFNEGGMAGWKYLPVINIGKEPRGLFVYIALRYRKFGGWEKLRLVRSTNSDYTFRLHLTDAAYKKHIIESLHGVAE